MTTVKFKSMAFLLLIVLGLLQTGCVSASDEQQFTGNVEGVSMTLAFESAGRIKVLDVVEGQMVKRGQVLGGLETEALALKLKSNALMLEKLENQKALLVNRLSDGEVSALYSDLSALKGQMESTRKDYETAQGKTAEIKALFAAGGASQGALDDAAERERKLKDQLNIQANTLSALSERISVKVDGPQAEELKAIDIEMALLGVQREELQLALQHSELKAPADGVVETRYHEIGELVNMGTPIFNLVDDKTLEFTVYVPETKLKSLKIGQKYGFVDASLKDGAFAELNFISPVAEFTPKNVESTESKHELVYRLVFSIIDVSGQVRPGMYLTLDLGELHE